MLAYDIVSGDGSIWKESEGGTVTIVANGLFDKFTGIKVDGEHVITVVYSDGETSGEFEVHLKGVVAPITGDNSNLCMWFALLFVSGGIVFVVDLTDKKRKSRS